MNETSDIPSHRVSCRPGRSPARLIVWLALLLLVLTLVACGREEDTPPTEAPATEPPAVVAEATTAPTQEVAEAPVSPLPSPSPVQEQEAYPAAEVATPVTVTVDANGNTKVVSPLEVDEGIDCEIESHIDLVGYPDLEQKLGCPVDKALTDPVAINEFGEGPEFDRFMLWFQNEGLIYVLFPDGSWQSFEDTWQEGDPTFACNPLGVEEDSPPLPRRGFGKLWCSDQAIQDVMGTIPREERLCQHSVLQPFADGRLLACFEDATIRYFRILNDHSWDVVVQ